MDQFISPTSLPSYLEQAAEVFHRLSDRQNEALTLKWLSRVHLRHWDFLGAIFAYERALARLEPLHRAVDRSEFIVRYQPLISVARQEITGVEALVRWQHPTRDELLPISFLEVAEETGLIIMMGEQVIQSACAQARAWIDEGWKDASVSVNLNARLRAAPPRLR